MKAQVKKKIADLEGVRTIAIDQVNETLGEPNVPRMELFFESIYQAYEKLKELGFAYFDGKVSICFLTKTR